MDSLRSFYDREYADKYYAPFQKAQDHSFFKIVDNFINTYQLEQSHCLEIGAGRGAFQDLVLNYTGLDISYAAARHFHKPFVQGSGNELPFQSNSFDAVWSYATLEHIPYPERALREIRRVLRHDGLLLLAPAWQCRPWAADGYPVRPFSDFGPKGKLIKASVPIRNSVLFRSTYVFPRRLYRLFRSLRDKPLAFKYRELDPNYDFFWMSDSDAINSMDPYEAILWFTSRGDRCLSHPGRLSQFLVRNGALVFRICKIAHSSPTDSLEKQV